MAGPLEKKGSIIMSPRLPWKTHGDGNPNTNWVARTDYGTYTITRLPQVDRFRIFTPGRTFYQYLPSVPLAKEFCERDFRERMEAAKPETPLQAADKLAEAVSSLRLAQRSYLGAKEYDPFISKEALNRLGKDVGTAAEVVDKALEAYRKALKEADSC